MINNLKITKEHQVIKHKLANYQNKKYIDTTYYFYSDNTFTFVYRLSEHSISISKNYIDKNNFLESYKDFIKNLSSIIQKIQTQITINNN